MRKEENVLVGFPCITIREPISHMTAEPTFPSMYTLFPYPLASGQRHRIHGSCKRSQKWKFFAKWKVKRVSVSER